MQGGQYNLNKKYIHNARLPNLADERFADGQLVGKLTAFGRAFAETGTPDPEQLDRATAAAYGIPLSRMRSALDPASARRADLQFQRLASEWQEATAHFSSLAKSSVTPRFAKL